MTAEVDAHATVDGRVERRRRNIETVIEVVLEMFGEDALFPTIEQVATRSGLSLRSVYRYFADPGELLEAVIRHNNARSAELSQLHGIGNGSLLLRVERFIAMRLRLHDGIGAVYRATLANAAHHDRVAEELTAGRDAMLAQFELQFAPELEQRSAVDRKAVTAAGDILTQLESIDYLRRHRGLSAQQVEQMLVAALTSLFA